MQKSLVCNHFEYLLNDEYRLLLRKNSALFFKNEIYIIISLDTFSYEVDCNFSLCNKRHKTVRLHDVLKIYDINLDSNYQISSLDKLAEGIEHISKILKMLIEKHNILNKNTLQLLIDIQRNNNRKLLKQYYVKADLVKADVCWKKKDYITAKVLYEKHKKNLSNIQNWKLEYSTKIISKST